ncbi:hypothetical protein LguiB_017704 [Lonicera macranthoides]
MDREQEDMQFLGIIGVYTQAYKVIISCRKVFNQITLALILPLSFIFLAHLEVSKLLFSRIADTETELDRTRVGTQRYERLSDLASSEWTYLWLFRAAYLTFLLVFSLLSTSAVVYTVACCYTARDVTFKKVMTVVPKVWKRLIVTFISTFLTFFAYHLVFGLIIIMLILTVGWTKFLTVLLYILIAFYALGFVYMTIIWQLASVVTVLENSYGFKAMVKSKELIKGNMVVAIAVFVKLNLFLFVIQLLFEKFVVHGQSLGLWARGAFGVLCLLLLFKLILFGLVIQTIIYFVCKSYHHENIDKSNLSDHLEVYLGEYVPLTTRDVQLEQFHV